MNKFVYDRITPTLKVVGSNPVGRTKKSCHDRDRIFCYSRCLSFDVSLPEEIVCGLAH